MIPLNSLTVEQVASICDHTFLKRPEDFPDIEAYDAAFHEFLKGATPDPYSICVLPAEVHRVWSFLQTTGKPTKICAAVGFPDRWEDAIADTVIAKDAGADEVDTVLDYRVWKEGRKEEAALLVQEVVAAAGGMVVKLILEVSELTKEQIAEVSELANSWGVAFVKTSTGFSKHGATTEAVRLMREHFNGGIKISGGVKAGNYKEFLRATSGDSIDLDPMKIRIGESGLLASLKKS